MQVRKLGEGFDHKYLAVAAVFSVFSNLSPFVQFVGRIMRVIEQNNSLHPLNQGVVVFHAGANIARRWEDFQNYSEADQEYFDQLLPLENFDFDSTDEIELEPTPGGSRILNPIEVQSQTGVQIQEIQLIKNDPEAIAAIKILQERGYNSDQVREAFEELKPVPITKVRERQAKRRSLETRVKTEAARILKERKINPEAHDLDKKRLGWTNLVVLVAAIHHQANNVVGRRSGERHEFTKNDLEKIEREFPTILENTIKEVFYVEN